MTRTLIAMLLALGWTTAAGGATASRTSDGTFEAQLRGQPIAGVALTRSEQQIRLLGRDGCLWEFRPQEATGLRKSTTAFRSYSLPELRAALERELGGRLELTSTQHYLVAHPRGAGKKWADRFEEIYRALAHYFSVRGHTLREPEFLLVAIVWPSQAEFQRYAQSQGQNAPAGLLGYYSPVNNRIALFDSSGGQNDAAAWQQNASTIIHEAAHQAAFNTGIHSRFASPPRWVAEGLGTLFEARGVYDWRHYPTDTDRLNRGRLAQFKQYLAAERKPGAFIDLVESDRLFQTDPGAAYSEAWALTFFLSETQPRAYNQYLAKTAGREPFTVYPAAQRRADFTAAFGSDLKLLEANYVRRMKEEGGRSKDGK